MQNVKFVIAKSFERIHRSNLVLMGIIPLEFSQGEDADKLGLTGKEEFSIDITDAAPRSTVTVKVTGGAISEFKAILRFDTETELTYFRVRRPPQAFLPTTAWAFSLSLLFRFQLETWESVRSCTEQLSSERRERDLSFSPRDERRKTPFPLRPLPSPSLTTSVSLFPTCSTAAYCLSSSGRYSVPRNEEEDGKDYFRSKHQGRNEHPPCT